MIRRVLPFLVIAIAATGCQQVDRPSMLRTGGYHIVDDRGWAVGSDVNFSAEMPFLNGQIELEQDGEVIATTGSTDGFYGGMGNVSGTVVNEGTFTIHVTNNFGVHQESKELDAKEIADFELGVLLDDCPEFPDLVMRDQPTILEGATVSVAPAPVDADGNQLLGRFDFTASNTIDGSVEEFEDDWWAGYTSINVNSPGDITFTVDGEDHVFPVDTVSPADVIDLQIAAIPEKHGVADESLLCALGITADGRVVHGINAQWDGGGTSQTIHQPNDMAVQACFDGKCATWDGVR